jgi:hypothetical protein
MKASPKKLDPPRLRCRKTPVTGWCYNVAKAKKGHVVEYRLMSEKGILMGWMDGECRMTHFKSNAHVFPGADAADRTAQKCILYNRKPSGKSVEAAYKPARGDKLG